MQSIREKADSEAARFWIRLSIAAGVVLLAAAVYSSGQSSDQSKGSGTKSESQPSLSGTWKINHDESDDPREKIRAAIQDREQNGSPGGMGGGGMGSGGIGMGIPGIGGGRHGGVQGSGSEEQHARLRHLIRAPEQVSIAQKGPEVDLTDSENHVRALFTDGRKLDKPKRDSPQVQVKAHWDHETLVSEEKGPDGEKISHTYEITNEGKQLADTLTLETKRLNTPIIIRSVYDKSE
jgi:hypothetical protein